STRMRPRGQKKHRRESMTSNEGLGVAYANVRESLCKWLMLKYRTSKEEAEDTINDVAIYLLEDSKRHIGKSVEQVEHIFWVKAENQWKDRYRRAQKQKVWEAEHEDRRWL